MELFPHGGFVRLRSRARDDKYVHADEDAVHVSLRSLGAVPSLNAVWKAQVWPEQGPDHDPDRAPMVVLLQGAAYGRYLAVAHPGEVVPSGHIGVRAIQLSHDLPNGEVHPDFMWYPIRLIVDQNHVRLHNARGCLRANGRHCHWKKLVTVDAWGGNRSTMLMWTVEAIPSTPAPLPLPPPPPQPPTQEGRGLFRRCTGHGEHQHPGRTIRYVRSDNDGNFGDEDWPEFVFNGNSVANLRTEIANREHDENITLGLRAGMNARVIPLVSNLPDDEDPMQIIVYATGSPAAEGLRYPQFDQPLPEPLPEETMVTGQ